MTIDHSYGLVSVADEKMARYGYGYMGYYNLKFMFQYTVAQMAENRALAKKLGTGAEWNKHCDDARLAKSEYMKPVMDAIAKELVCYQYDHDKDEVEYKFNSADWDLFFWCDCTHNNFGEIVGDNRDMSYFTLGFNKKHDSKRQEDVLSRVLAVLKQFENDENLYVIIEHDVIVDDKKVREDSRMFAPLLVGKKCTYKPHSVWPVPPMEGKVVEHDGVYYFMKKRARNRGFRLDSEDIIELAIQTGVNEVAA